MNSAGDDKTLPSARFTEAHRCTTVSEVVPKESVPQFSEPPSESTISQTQPTYLVADKFTECELIGNGGMSLVIRAFDNELQRDVAIKLLTPQSSANEVDVARLAEEARITGRLDHPYIVPAYEFGTDDRGVQFLCMKLVKGETLEDTLSWAGLSRLEPDFLADLLQIFTKVCDAVSFAHSRGILHRDVKPSNVMIGDFGQVYVIDWGVARRAPQPPYSGESADVEPLTDPIGMLAGTPRYMAPEQLRGLHDQMDERTDVFGLGAMLYQILTGQPPHDPDSLTDIALRKRRVTIPRPEQVVIGATVPAELSRIALKAMSHDPVDRYASVDELKNEVECFQRGVCHLPRECFAAGAVIIGEGEKSESAYIIVEGYCVAFARDGDDEVVLRHLGPGDVFGETAVFSDKPRTASVRAHTDTVVMVVKGDVLSRALGSNRWMSTFFRALADRFCALDQRVRQLELGECLRCAPSPKDR